MSTRQPQAARVFQVSASATLTPEINAIAAPIEASATASVTGVRGAQIVAGDVAITPESNLSFLAGC